MFKNLQSLQDKFVRHFSHNDLDGFAPQILSELSIFDFGTYIHCGYDNFEAKLEETIVEFEKADKKTYEEKAILITDISPSTESVKLLERLNALFEAGVTVVLLDHHDTAKPISEKYPKWALVEKELEGQLTCATELYYLYLKEKDAFGFPFDESKYLADFVEQVRSYDTWDWSRTGNVFAKELNSVLYAVGSTQFIDIQIEKIANKVGDPNADTYGFDHVEVTLVEVENKREEKYIQSRQKNLIESTWKVADKDYKVGVVFADQFHSTLGNELSKANAHLDFIAILDMNSGKGSLRTISTSVHLGEIAKAMAGGGGHPMAAGFQFSTSNVITSIEEVLDVKESKVEAASKSTVTIPIKRPRIKSKKAK